MRRFVSTKAFTLIELLIVVAIIAILAAIAVPNFLEAQMRSKVARVKADMRSLATAINSFQIDHNWIPPDGIDPKWATDPASCKAKLNNQCGAAPWFIKDYWDTGIPNLWTIKEQIFLTTPVAYMSSLPDDPFNSQVQNATFRGMMWENDINRRQFGMDLNAGTLQDIAYEGTTNVNGNTRWDWGLYSYGPDLMVNWDSRFKVWQGRYTEYDPTNGTMSGGDIHRVGP